MKISRMDLDGRGSGSPDGLVTLILKLEPNLPIPVPIDDLCRQLDIQEIAPLETEGFEGALLTDTARSRGIILVNQQASRKRRRFTVAHELGHFLLASHIPDADGRFLCSRADMSRMTAKEGDRRTRMEVEANRFASLLLIPPPALRLELRSRRRPDLQHIPQLHTAFDVSKEAISRAYAIYHEDLVAILIVHEGVVRRIYQDRIRFPYIHIRPGQPVPRRSAFHRLTLDRGVATDPEACPAETWVSDKYSQRLGEMTEQVYPQSNGFALIMLHLAEVDEEEETEERDLQESWRVGFRSHRR